LKSFLFFRQQVVWLIFSRKSSINSREKKRHADTLENYGVSQASHPTNPNLSAISEN
jgi:hypothetical protein